MFINIGDLVTVNNKSQVYVGDLAMAKRLGAQNWQEGADLPSGRIKGKVKALDRSNNIVLLEVKHQDYLVSSDAVHPMRKHGAEFEF